jgi:hypothetical protein
MGRPPGRYRSQPSGSMLPEAVQYARTRIIAQPRRRDGRPRCGWSTPRCCASPIVALYTRCRSPTRMVGSRSAMAAPLRVASGSIHCRAASASAIGTSVMPSSVRTLSAARAQAGQPRAISHVRSVCCSAGSRISNGRARSIMPLRIATSPCNARMVNPLYAAQFVRSSVTVTCASSMCGAA